MSLENEFAADLHHSICIALMEHNIKFPTLRRMIDEHGSVQTAKRLLKTSNCSDGFIKLLEVGRLDLSIEHLVVTPKYQLLFTDPEKSIAKKKLDLKG